MRKIPRAYQRKASRKGYESIAKGNQALVVMPTGSGKTIVICMITDRYLTDNIEKDVLVLSHRASILQQDYKALSEYFPDFETGLYSAGLGSRTIKKITVAGIQSIYKKAEEFVDVGLIIIDEAHLINHKAQGMYRTFLKELGELGAQYLGLTATHFRLGHGFIHKGEDAIFNDLAYDLSETENYNKLVDDGFLSPMYPANTKLKINTDGIKMRGEEFRADSSSEAIDRESITDAACNEIVIFAREHNLKKWLVFAIDIEHAIHINEKMVELGVISAVIHSNLIQEEIDAIMELYEKGVYQCVINVELLTTGLDIPDIDLIGILRPTNSPSLHVQILGRGGRPVYADGYDLTTRKGRLKGMRKGPKPCCWIMDFAGNTDRLGPINNVTIEENAEKRRSSSKGNPIMKVCPDCDIKVHVATRECDFCGHEFKFQEKITSTSSTAEVMTKDNSRNEATNGWYKVDDVQYRIHSIKGKPSSLRVQYKCGVRIFSEFICMDHKGYARNRALNWLRFRVKPNTRKPRNLRELYSIRADLMRPNYIKIESNGNWKNVVDFKMK